MPRKQHFYFVRTLLLSLQISPCLNIKLSESFLKLRGAVYHGMSQVDFIATKSKESTCGVLFRMRLVS